MRGRLAGLPARTLDSRGWGPDLGLL